jgi:hypothetical protein
LRVAYRILKNAGLIPPELELANEVRSIEQLLDSLPEGGDRTRAMRKLHLLNLKLAESKSGGRARLPVEYYRKVIDKLS